MILISNKYWEVKETINKGKGLFAKKEIKRGTVIGDYLGKVIKTAEYDLNLDKYGLFLMYLTDEASIYPNLKKPGIHLFNHSCNANCGLYVYHGHTLFFALRKIKAGEELTISYMLSPKDSCNPCPHDCRCNSKFCTGTMHLPKVKYEKWQKFQDNQKKKTKIAKVVFGKNLPKLTSYPKFIPTNPIYKEF